MTRFTTTVRTDDVLHGTTADDVWTAMRDPALLADLAPAVAEITAQPADGGGPHPAAERWCWRMVGINALGVSASPAFTVLMAFDDADHRITFDPDPQPGSSEAAGARGTWLAVDVPDGCYVGIELEAHVDLPLPKLAAGAVTRIMERTIVIGGQRFARNLEAHLGVTSTRGMEVVRGGWPRIPAGSRN